MTIDPFERTILDTFGAGAVSTLTMFSIAEYGPTSEPTILCGIFTAMFAANSVTFGRQLHKGLGAIEPENSEPFV